MRGARLARHLLLPLLAILVLFTPVTEARVRDFLRTTGANKIAIRVKPIMVSSAKHQPDRRKKGQKAFDQPKVHRAQYHLASGVALIWSAACSGVAREAERSLRRPVTRSLSCPSLPAQVPDQAETQRIYGQQVFPTYWIHA